MKTIHKRLLIGVLLIGVIVVLRFFGIHKHFTLEAIRHESLSIQNFIHHFYGLSVLLLIGVFAITVTFAIPATPLLTLASGYFFGVIPGAFYAILGATLGATIAFFIFRYLLRSTVERRYSKAMKRFNEQFNKQGASYLLFMQLLPITPFLVIIIISSLSSVSWLTFVWTSIVGIAPGSVIYAFAGQQLMTIKKTSDILSWPIIIALVLLACIALLPIVVKRFKPSSQFE